MTLAVSQKGLFTLQQFQAALIERIDKVEKVGCINTEEEYYTCWLEALQDLLEGKNLWQANQLAQRETEVVKAGEHRQELQRQTKHQVQPEIVK